MFAIKRKVSLLRGKNLKVESRLTQKCLEEVGLQGIHLRAYQLEGVTWMKRCFRSGHGCILGDEMGLGKTIQTVALLTNLHGAENCPGPFLIVCPLSVLQNWKSEFLRFSKHLIVIGFIGDKEERDKLKESLKNLNTSQSRGDKNDALSFHVLLTTFEMCLRETTFLSRFSWKALVVDEAHRLKNSKSMLYQELSQFQKDFVVLLTGTPVQNNLSELYSLLSFISPNIFSFDAVEEFLERYTGVFNCAERNAELQKLLSPFLLRRVKSEVSVKWRLSILLSLTPDDFTRQWGTPPGMKGLTTSTSKHQVMAHLPKKTEVLLYTGMSDLQRKYYRAILMKDLDAFDSPVGTSKTRLLNILIQLRKCVNHPYLFDGVEPEPFRLGEHLVDSSGKLQVIDQLLIFLKARGHKVLMFSQMTRMLDIIQDYLGYRGYSYERLDGSVRGEERYLAIQNFNDTEDTFIFLLSTRAGGQGLNLMSADTVIFVDSDFNPQNDLQAAARAHRIGQTRPVKIIRLVTRSTVEEIVLRRADEKLKLTNAVIENGKFSGSASAVNQIAETPTQLADMLKFGLDKLSESQESAATEKDLERILGASCDNKWIVEQETGDESIGKDDDDATSSMQIDDDGNVESMYVYEGRDYSKETTDRDQQAFDNMVAEILANVQSEERVLRGDERKSTAINYFDPPASRKRKVLTPEELEERRKKREENALKRAKLQEEAELRREVEKQRKLEKLWKDNNYVSLNTALDDDEENVDEESDALDKDDDSERKDIQYVRGDVTHPVNTRSSDAIIVHCVDDSGWWGQGGLFSALSRRSLQPETQYELAGKMKDLNLGDAHLVPIDDQERKRDGHDYVALIVAQSRDRKNQLSAILLTSLSQGLRRVSLAAKRMKATVHLPRIGYNTPSFNWYGTERLIRKHLASKGIETSIYYYARRHQVSSGSLSLLPSGSNVGDPTLTQNRNKSLKEDSPACGDFRGNLPNFMRGVNVFFFNVDEYEKKKLARYLVAYDGEVSHFACQSVTHVVCDKHADTSITFEEWMVGVKIVSSKWLVKCFKKGRQVDTKPYEIENS